MGNEEKSFKLEAGVLALSLRLGYKHYADVIKWADAEIMRRDSLSDDLYKLSLAKTASQALKSLNEMSFDVNYWEVLDAFLDHIPETMPYKDAKILAGCIYRYLVTANDWPQKYAGLFGYDDDFYLIERGALAKSKDALLAEFFSEIRRVAHQDRIEP